MNGKCHAALLLVCMLMAATSPVLAQYSTNKLSASTQMFLDERAGRISFEVSQKQIQERAKAKGITAVEAARQAKWDRPIAAPVTKGGQEYISAFVRLTDPSGKSELEALGVEIECEFLNGTLYTTLIPVDKIEAVAQIAKVSRISVATKRRPLTNAARSFSNVDDVLAYTADARAAGLPNAFDGSGVLLGVIDTGIDFQHKAFKDKDGNFRIKRAYVYTGSGSAREYGDGASYALSASAPTTDDSSEDHGTHTSSTAGGSSVMISGSTTTVTDDHANATYGGMAPGADLYLAGCDLSDTYLANSFQKIINYADSKNMPVVVSNSWGGQFGPHDGTGDIADVVNQYFGDSHPNHICLFAASNDAGTNGFHVSGTASSSSPLGTVINYNTSYGLSFYYGIIANAWTRSTGVTLNCKIIVINSSGTKVAEVSVNPSTNGTTVSGISSYVSSGSLIAYRDYTSGSDKSQILLYAAGSSYYGGGLTMRSGYKLAVQFYPASGSSVVDVWSGSAYTYYTATPSTSGYTWTAGSDDMCVSDEATIANAISIGAYSTKNKVTDYNGTSHSLDYTVGDIADFSSYATATASPTGLAYPWIAAPGATVVAGVNAYDTSGDYSYINGNAAQYGMYRVNSDTTNPYGSMEGTSMATPTAAGIVALWLQAAKSVGKELTTNDIKEIMKATAITDSYTNGTNKAHFGNGKIDALAGIKYILGDATPVPTIVADPTSLSFTGTKGQTYTKTVTVTGTNLEGNITVTKSGDAAYTIDKTSITKGNDGSANATITVTYKPTAAGNTTATLTLKSSNANDVTVAITGTAVAPTITATPATVTFSAETGDTKTQTVTIKGTNLGGNITAAISGDAAYTIDKTSITQSAATSGTTLTITYRPTAVGSTTARVTLKSSNADDVTINISGTATAPVPTITASTTAVNFPTCYTGEDATQTFTITGKNLTGNITAALTDQNEVFSLNTTAITPAEAAQGKAITVTFSPKAARNYTGSVRLTADGATAVTVSLSGNGQLLKVVPVMEPADTNLVRYTSFRADWTDETPDANVSSYTLWVNQYVEPQFTLLLKETFTKFTTANTNTDISSQLNNYMDNSGWTGSRLYRQVGAIRVGSNSYAGTLTSPALDLSNSGGKMTIKIKAKANDSNSQIVITCGNTTQNITAPSTVGEQTVVLDVTAAAGQQVSFQNTARRKRFDISGIEIYSGDATTSNAAKLLAAVEQGDSTSRTITGITDKCYTVSDLTGGGTFDYKVKAIYADNTESDWSNIERVTLKPTPDVAGLKGDVNLDGVVDVTDVNILIAIVLGNDNPANYERRAYINDDDIVDVSDVNAVIAIILGIAD